MTVRYFTISDTSPASASTVVGDVIAGLNDYDWFTIDASLAGATGGTLDVYLQRLVGDPTTSTTWRDWLHFPQLAAGAAAVAYHAQSFSPSPTLTVVGTNTTPVIAANTFLGGHPGNQVRALYVAGAGTSAGVAQSIVITCWRRPHS